MPDRSIEAARILIVDDEPANVVVLERTLRRSGYENIVTTTDPRDALTRYLEDPPDLLVLDLQMPYLNGFEVLERIAPVADHHGYLPVLVLTADATSGTRRKALGAGAHDFLTKPFDALEVLLRIRNLLHTRLLHVQLRQQNEELEQRVAERTRDLDHAREETLRRLALAAEFRDDQTYEHTERVGAGAAVLGIAAGLSCAEAETLRLAAPLHDVGKIGISDTILLKPGKLTDDEFALMKEHTVMGARILSGSNYDVLCLGETVALSHHERWDGRGYPKGLGGEEIPLSGRIVSLVDVFDALTHERPYKRAWSRQEALDEIVRGRGSQFDPRLVDLFAEGLE